MYAITLVEHLGKIGTVVALFIFAYIGFRIAKHGLRIHLYHHKAKDENDDEKDTEEEP